MQKLSFVKPFTYAQFADVGYECSSQGDLTYSALFARLEDGRTIEEAYQLDVKGYRRFGDHWKIGKGKPPLRIDVDLWAEYLLLWKIWASENPRLIDRLWRRANRRNRVLTDRFASTDISQARALSQILNEYERL